MLPVNINQKCRRLPENRQWYQFSINSCHTPAAGNPPGDDHLIPIHRYFHFLELCKDLRTVHFKIQFYKGIFRVFPDHISGDLTAEGCTNGTDNDRLTGACLTCKNIQMTSEINIRLINERHVFYMYILKHFLPLPFIDWLLYWSYLTTSQHPHRNEGHTSRYHHRQYIPQSPEAP